MLLPTERLIKDVWNIALIFGTIDWPLYVEANKIVKFQASRDFLFSLTEVDTLLSLAEEDTNEKAKFKVLLKSALILLSGKFETFAEDISEEYLFNINQLNAPPQEIPLPLRIHHTLKAIQSVNHFRNRERFQEAEKYFTELFLLWSSNRRAPQLNIECKFSSGKHGEEEFKKLFWNIGIEDIFDYIFVQQEKESLLTEDTEKVQVDFRGTFNSMTNIRNNILHQDATPNLTVPQVKEYRLLLQNFCIALESKLQESILRISEVCANCS